MAGGRGTCTEGSPGNGCYGWGWSRSGWDIAILPEDGEADGDTVMMCILYESFSSTERNAADAYAHALVGAEVDWEKSLPVSVLPPDDYTTGGQGWVNVDLFSGGSISATFDEVDMGGVDDVDTRRASYVWDVQIGSRVQYMISSGAYASAFDGANQAFAQSDASLKVALGEDACADLLIEDGPPVPTLSQWSLLLMVLLMGGGAVVGMRRFRPVPMR